MELGWIDITIFFAFVVAVVTIGVSKSRDEKDSESYFLAGRGLLWPLIGFSLIAANISTEQFVGMTGQAAGAAGMAIASYEWLAAITLVVMAFFFLPKFLKSGIYTIPEFLEHRYTPFARTIMALLTMLIYVFVTITAVIYTGALPIDTLFGGQQLFGFIDINVVSGSWIIGIIAAVYVASGGLKACAWADLIQGSALILGGIIILTLIIGKMGEAPVDSLKSASATVANVPDSASGFTKFFALNKDKLHMVLPASNKFVPWTALVLGLWIPNFYYWGLNQYIIQRTLGSHSLAQGQKGVVFAAAMKIIVPFAIVFPGIAAFNLYSSEMANEAAEDPQIIEANQRVWDEFEAGESTPGEEPYVVFEYDEGWANKNPQKLGEVQKYNEIAKAAATSAGVAPAKESFMGYKHDAAFGLLLKKVLPSGVGLQGFVLAAILGAVVSSIASMLNAASTIFTMDIYRNFFHKNASQKALVLAGRIAVVVFVLIGCIIAPKLADPKFGGIFSYIQEFQGFISPGILAIFLFGLFVRKAPRFCGWLGLLLSPAIYALLKWVLLPNLAFLDRMALTFLGVVVSLALSTLLAPLPQPVKMPVNEKMDLTTSKGAKTIGIIVVIVTFALYVIFW